MAIHKNLPSSEIHEPKDIETAIAGQVYIADGLGSGGWGQDSPINFVFINDEADFPAAVSGVITLEDDKVYLIGSDVSTTSRFVIGENCVISCYNTNGATLTYTGVDAMFTGVDKTFTIHNGRVNCPNGTLVDLSSPSNTHVFRMDFSTCISCAKLAKFTNMLGTVIHRCSILDADQGAEYLGTSVLRYMNITDCVFVSTSASYVAFDLGSVVFESFSFNKANVDAPAGAIGLAGSTGSANVLANKIAVVKEVAFADAMSATDGNILPTDIRWKFRDNAGIADSYTCGETYLNLDRTVPVAATSTFYPVAGTDWLTGTVSGFTVSTSGILTYVKEKDAVVKVTVHATVTKAAAGTDDIEMRIALNGTTQAKSSNTTASSSKTAISCQAILTVSQNDTLQVYVANNSTVTNIVVHAGSNFSAETLV